MHIPLRTPDQLGQQLRALRKARGLSQTDLGRLIGVGQTRVAEIEAKPGLVSGEQLMRVIRALGAELVLNADMVALPRGNAGRKTSARKTLTSAKPIVEPNVAAAAKRLGLDEAVLRRALADSDANSDLPSPTDVRTAPGHRGSW